MSFTTISSLIFTLSLGGRHSLGVLSTPSGAGWSGFESPRIAHIQHFLNGIYCFHPPICPLPMSAILNIGVAIFIQSQTLKYEISP